MTRNHRSRVLLTSAATLALGLPLVTLSLPAAAQQQAQPQAQEQQPQQGQAQQQDAAPAATVNEDALIATVNEVEIRESDITEAISTLPPQVQQMPPQMLLPTVLDQLVLRNLIVERARGENLEQDPEVVALIERGVTAVEDQALVQVWLQRELEERVTDAAVQEAFTTFQTANPNVAMTLEQLRPQIEQALQQQAVAEIRTDLREGAEITFYGPGGEPIDPAAQQAQAGVEGQQAQAQPAQQDQPPEQAAAQAQQAQPTGQAAAPAQQETEAKLGELYTEWAGEDNELTVAEWDAAIDQRFGEQDASLVASEWDDDGNGIISREEFEEAFAEGGLLSKLQQ